jgi:hypothetical protein
MCRYRGICKREVETTGNERDQVEIVVMFVNAISGAARSEARNVVNHSNTEIVGSNRN